MPGHHKRPTTSVPTEVARALRKRMTRQEAKLRVALRRLRPAGFTFRRQAPIGPFVVDFACLKARLVVEVDREPRDRDRLGSMGGRA